MTTEVLNLEFIRELEESGPELLPELYRIFSESSRERMTELERALKSKHWDEFRKVAHSLRSSSLNLGALRFPEVMLELEKFSEGSEESLPEKLTLAREELRKMKVEIARRLA